MVPSQPLRTASDAGAPVDPDASAQNLVPSWLPKAKVLAPALPAGYVRHASLLHHIEGLLERRLTVLRAPAGFGKTTVLADVVCGVKAQGLVAGWISLDEDDAPNLFGSCLASAFEHAGLDLALINVHDAWSSSPAVHQMGMLARAIELHAAPCLLVLDEVDRLPRRTVQLINLLLTRAPANLHLAMAFRSDPGLDLATHVLAGEAIVVGVRQCRFSTADIARFFHGKLSRRELAKVVELTAGWPVALLLYRNMRAHEAKGLGADAERLTENYVGVRLLRDLSATDRACLLDLAVFDWLDDDLVDEVLGTSDARVRIAAVSSLDGLLVPINPDRTVRRMHPMLRDYCVGLLSVEDPARKRALHGRIALALARRDDLPSAWRHASAAGDSRLVGELIERVGAYALWLRAGDIRLIAADRFLTPEIMEWYPRLALLHCIILRLSLKTKEATALYEAVRQRTDGFTRDREGGDAEALTVGPDLHARDVVERHRSTGAGRDRCADGGRRRGRRWRDPGPVRRPRPAPPALPGLLRTRQLRGVPPARPAMAGALRQGRAVRHHFCRHVPGDGGHGAGTGAGGPPTCTRGHGTARASSFPVIPASPWAPTC